MKNLRVYFALAAAVAVLAGCGGSGGTGSAEDDPAGSGASAEEETAISEPIADSTDYTEFCSVAVAIAELDAEADSWSETGKDLSTGEIRVSQDRLDASMVKYNDILARIDPSVPASLRDSYNRLLRSDSDEVLISEQAARQAAKGEIDGITVSECDLSFDVSGWIATNLGA